MAGEVATRSHVPDPPQRPDSPATEQASEEPFVLGPPPPDPKYRPNVPERTAVSGTMSPYQGQSSIFRTQHRTLGTFLLNLV